MTPTLNRIKATPAATPMVADNASNGPDSPAGHNTGWAKNTTRLTMTAATLVEQQHAILVRVEQPPVVGTAAAAGFAMQKHGWLATGIAAKLPVDLVAVANVQHAGLAKGSMAG